MLKGILCDTNESIQSDITKDIIYQRKSHDSMETYNGNIYQLVGPIHQDSMKHIYSKELIQIFIENKGFPTEWKTVINSNGTKRGKKVGKVGKNSNKIRKSKRKVVTSSSTISSSSIKKKKKVQIFQVNEEDDSYEMSVQSKLEHQSEYIPWAEQNIVSPIAHKNKITRSGRQSMKPLPFWANYRLLNGHIRGSNHHI